MNKFAFFGTDEFAVTCLEELKNSGQVPALIITTPDKPKGRKLLLTPSPVKLWVERNKINYLQPEKLKDFVLPDELKSELEFFLVASYGKIIPKYILALPQFGTLNIHPSLLPQYRGSSPIQTTILNGDEKTGVSIMLLDEELDHGPVLAQAEIEIKQKTFLDLRDELAKLGVSLLVKILPDYLSGKLEAKPQDHNQATFAKKIEKSAGEIKLTDKAEINFRKFRAYTPWPGIYFFDKNNKRIKITEASLENGVLKIKKVIPEGKSEMTWEDWERGLQK